MLTESDRPSAPTACFSVQARAEPGAMPRVLELFVKRGVVPSQWHSTLAGPAHGELHIDIQVEGMDRTVASYVAWCLRQLVDVETVLISEKGYAQTA